MRVLVAVRNARNSARNSDLQDRWPLNIHRWTFKKREARA